MEELTLKETREFSRRAGSPFVLSFVLLAIEAAVED
jgi:hypothetical protein